MTAKAPRPGGGERAEPDEAGKQARGPAEDPHEGGGEDGDERDAAAVDDVGVAVQRGHHGGDRRDAANADEVVRPARQLARATAAGREPQRPAAPAGEKRREGAHEQLPGARVRPVVHPRGIRERVVEDGHLDERGEREDGHDEARGPPVAHGAREQEQDERPHEVELHGDAHEPEVRERRGEAGRGEVGNLAHDVEEVLEEEERGNGVGADLRDERGREERAEHGRRAHDDEHGGQKAADAPQQEPRVVEGAHAGDLPLDREGGEVSREDEERAHAEVAPRKPRGVGVVDDDGGYGEDAKAVERGDPPGA